MAQDYDNMVKNLLTDYATDISQFVLGVTDVEVIENIDTEQQIIVGQRTDSTKRIRVNNQDAILHIELHLRDSTQKPMWARNAAYHGYLVGEHQLPVYSNVIYFHPNAGRNDTGIYKYSWQGYEYKLQYKVIRLSQIDGQTILEKQTPGLLPFLPLMKPKTGMDTEKWVQDCIDAAIAVSTDQQMQSDLLCALSLFGSIVHDAELFKRHIPEEIMQESKYYQLLREQFIAQGIAQGIEQGARNTTIRHILALLESKFSEDAVKNISKKVESIDDLQRLEELHSAASKVQNLDTFLDMLDV